MHVRWTRARTYTLLKVIRANEYDKYFAWTSQANPLNDRNINYNYKGTPTPTPTVRNMFALKVMGNKNNTSTLRYTNSVMVVEM